MSDIILWGFDGSTYVRTVKMVLAEKGVTQFKQMQLNVLKGCERFITNEENQSLFDNRVLGEKYV